MLKIKDNVDLKELEKFGFYEDKEFYIDNMIKFKLSLAFGVPIIEKETRRIEMLIDKNLGEGLSVFKNKNLITSVITENVYDLIKADLVEKVSDKE
jgi:hypothetical protein